MSLRNTAPRYTPLKRFKFIFFYTGTSATLVPSKSSEKFFVIPNTERDTKVWRRPSLFTTGVVGPVVVFPSRVQPQGSGYAKGFYPVTYTFQDTEGNILETDEFVVVYQSGE